MPKRPPFLNYFLYKMTYRGTGIAASAEITLKGGLLSFGKGNAVGARTRLVLPGDSRIVLEDRTWLGNDVLVEPLPGHAVLLGKDTSVQDRCRLIGDMSIG